MEFRIADTFTARLARLTAEHQRSAKTSAFDLQINPAHPGLQFHRLDNATDHNFWSVRVNSDVRMIVHRTTASLLLCYVDHHDEAYHWAERRKLETHPKTGAAKLVEIYETVIEIKVPCYVDAPAATKPPLFAHITDDELLSYRVPPEWLADARTATDDTIPTVAQPPTRRSRRRAHRSRHRSQAETRPTPPRPRRPMTRLRRPERAAASRQAVCREAEHLFTAFWCQMHTKTATSATPHDSPSHPTPTTKGGASPNRHRVILRQ